MKCVRCGREMELVRELTNEEKDKLDYFNSKEQVGNEGLSADVLNNLTLEESKIVDYMNAAMEQKVEAQILRRAFLREISEEIGITDFDIIDYKIYKHLEE